MRLRTRLITGLALAAGGLLVWIVLVSDGVTIPGPLEAPSTINAPNLLETEGIPWIPEAIGVTGLVIVAVAIVIGLVGDHLAGITGAAVGAIVGSFIGAVWLPVVAASTFALPAWGDPALLLVPVGTYVLAGFILGRRIPPVALLVAALIVAGSVFLLPDGQDQLVLLTGYVAAPVVITGLTLLGATVRRPTSQVEQ